MQTGVQSLKGLQKSHSQMSSPRTNTSSEKKLSVPSSLFHCGSLLQVGRRQLCWENFFMGNCIAYAPKEMLWIFSLHWNVLNCVKFRSQVWGSDFTVSQTKNLYFILFVLFCLFCHYGRQCCKLGLFPGMVRQAMCTNGFCLYPLRGMRGCKWVDNPHASHNALSTSKGTELI